MILFIFRVAIVLAIAFGVGALSALYSIRASSGFGALRIGQWLTYPGRGSEDADPYSKARAAREGAIPLGAAEGIEFLSSRDSSGAALRRDCNYRVEGQVPLARYWTIFAIGEDGAPLRSQATGDPSALHSRQLARRADGTFEVRFGPRPQPGNWAVVEGGGPMSLVIVLYDTPVAAAPAEATVALPAVVRETCGA